MVAKLFTKPFGVAGDKTPIPNGTQVDGTVSYETGFGADYERQLGVDPAAKNIGRQSFNELMFDVTTSLQEMQAGFGTSPYSLALAQALPGGGYPKGALIPRLAGDGFWQCTTAGNISNPDTGGAGWAQIATQGSFYAVDTGVANTYSCTFTPAITTRSESQILAVRIKTTNSGPSTVNDGIGSVPLLGLAQQPLQGGELVANGVATLQWVAAIASYVVVSATAGAVQVVNASKSLQAVNASQVQLQSTTAFYTTGTAIAQVLTPVPAIDAYATNLRFNVTFNVASDVNPTINVSGKGPKNLKQYSPSGAKVAAVFAALQNTDIVYDGADFVLLDQLPSDTTKSPTFESLELRGLEPYIDFSNDPTTDYDARILLVDNDTIDILGVGNTGLRVGGATVITTAAIATQSQVNTGTDDATVVTPKKLRAGFQSSFTSNGYIAFPTWLGGLIIQWGRTALMTDAGSLAVTLPMTFPSAALQVWTSLYGSVAGDSGYCRESGGQITNTSQILITYNETSAALGGSPVSWLAIGL